uniref:Uncharacterized protein n=1 Tax=Gallus gallus TaxID=9031 RepID=A0A8V0ZEB4_CHICK
GQGRNSPQVLLTSNQMGRFISFSTWQALVVTELTPEHHSTEKSQGWFTTYRLTEMLSWRYCLCRESREHTFWPQLCSKNAPQASVTVPCPEFPQGKQFGCSSSPAG